ncbi:MAG: ABC transporter substrate-binding protein [Chloroflexi bacterium]|nr:ABC transporter substrate-binding protein [Chloroflexota bacterium]
MLKQTRPSWLIALTLICSLLLAACGSSSVITTSVATKEASTTPDIPYTATALPTPILSSTEIRIGVIGPFTGPADTLGNSIRYGVELATDDANAAGGINGRKIVLIERDDKTEPEIGLSNVQDLIEKEKANALIGTANTGAAAREVPLVNQDKIPWIIPVASGPLTSSNTISPTGIITSSNTISPTGTITSSNTISPTGIITSSNTISSTGTITNSDTTPKINYVFRLSMRDDDQAAFVASYVVDKLKAQKIAVLHDSSNYGNLGKDDLLKTFNEKNVKPLMVESFKTYDSADNFKALLTKVKQAGADTLVIWCPGADAVGIRNAAKEVGLNITTVGPWNLSMPPFSTNAKGLEEGALVPQTISVDSTNPKAIELFDKYKKKYKTDTINFPSGLVQSYDAMNMLIAALKQPGTMDSRDKLRDALANLDSYEGVIKKYEKPFGNQNQEALNRDDFLMTTWKGGKLVKLG